MSKNKAISSYLEDYYWYWFCNIPRIGKTKLRQLLMVFESPEHVYKADVEVLRGLGLLSDKELMYISDSKKDNMIYEEFISIRKKGIHFTYPGKEDYPQRLLHIYDYPLCLYYYGKLPDDNKPSVAIVGSRQNTTYGYNVAGVFAKSFAKMGIQVISGLARGIDGAAHMGAFKADGYTCGVLGCGVDICYPRQNIEFPVRNRIISGLSDVVIVVEARKKSGSLITVDAALEQNKEVMVVPGRIGDSLSEGCNDLIKLGAAVITRPEDILDIEEIRRKLDDYRNIYDYKSRRSGECYIGMITEENETICNKTEEKSTNSIPEYEQNVNSVHEFKLATPKNMLYSCVDLYPVGLNELIEKTGLSLQEISNALVELELEGKIEEVADNCYARIYV